MSDEFPIKPIRAGAVPAALGKAEQYRRLNEPGQAESICLDVLEIEPDNQEALRLLILSLTDKFAREHSSASEQQTRRWVEQLKSEYERIYFTGIVHERGAKAMLGRGHARVFAYDRFRAAMDCYQRAESLRPADNDDCILRWNSCVRAIDREGLEPRQDEGELPLE